MYLYIIMFLILSVIFIGLGLSGENLMKKQTDLTKREHFNRISNFFKSAGYICIALTIAAPIVFPQYKVWQQNKEGEAELARAEQNRKITVLEAKAKEDAAASLANAEILRARGIAQANKIIGDSLQNNDAYIHYLWIEALKESKNDVIYIPTEAGIPITESARFFKKQHDGKEVE